ncbi:MAG: Protoheme IX farnesyltransferase, mitochondrial, partial [Paramarteilia canceri]
DSLMKRTNKRLLVTGKCSVHYSLLNCILCAALGTGFLYFGSNILSALLALGNILLYGVIYTFAKRFTVLNTEIGSVVGALPPFIGYCSANATNIGEKSFILP